MKNLPPSFPRSAGPLFSFHLCGWALFLFCFLLMVCSCAVAVRKTPFQWPASVNYIEGTGDMDLSWKGRTFSGSFALKLVSPSRFLFEVYGPFGQTLLQVKKEAERVDILTADGRTNERLFEDQYGMRVDNFIDDLMMKGTIKEAAEGKYLERRGYRVVYTGVADKPKACWLQPDGTICLAFTELILTRDGQSDEGSRN